MKKLKFKNIQREREEKKVKKGEEMEQNGNIKDIHADVKQIEEIMDMDPETFLKLKKMENQNGGASNKAAVRVADSSSYMKVKSDLFAAVRYL